MLHLADGVLGFAIPAEKETILSLMNCMFWPCLLTKSSQGFQESSAPTGARVEYF